MSGLCAKVRYESRASARRARRQIADPALRAYRCLVCERAWHLGHLADPIRRGRRSRGDIYGDEA